MNGPLQADTVVLFAKTVLRDIPMCTGCDFAHNWDDHVLAIARAKGIAWDDDTTPEIKNIVMTEPPCECGESRLAGIHDPIRTWVRDSGRLHAYRPHDLRARLGSAAEEEG